MRPKKKAKKAKPHHKADTLTDKPYLGRDELFLRLLQGIVKAGIETDQKKEQDRRACRKKVDEDENS
jgi:hypothetical protein